MAIAKLSIDLEARIASLQEGLSRAERLNAQAVSSMQARWSKLDGVGANFAAGLKTALAGLTFGALASQLKAVAEGVDALNDAADATGSSIENLSALEDIGARTGTSFETVTAALVKFNKLLAEASDPSSAAAEGIKRLGLNIDALKSKDLSLAFVDYSRALGQFAEGSDKARFVADQLGRSYKELAPFIADVAKKGELNATVTTRQAEEAEKFNQQLSALAKNSQDFARSIVGDVLPALNAFLERWQRIGGLSGIFDNLKLRGEVSATQDEINRLNAEIERVDRLIKLNPTGNNTKAIANLDEMRSRLQELSAVADQVNGRVAAMNDRFGDITQADGSDNRFARMKKAIGEIPQAAEKAKKAVDKLLDPTRFDVPFPGLQEALKAIADTDASKIERLKGELEALLFLEGRDPTKTGLGEAIANTINQIDSLTPAGRKAAEELKRLTDLIEASDVGQLAAQQRDLDLLLDSFARGQISEEQFASAVKKRFDLATEAVKSHGQALSDMDKEWERFGENIQRGFGDTITAALRGDFDSIEKLWKDLLARMVAEALSANLTGFFTKTLLPAITGAFGGGGGAAAAGGSTAVPYFGNTQKGGGRGDVGAGGNTVNVYVQDGRRNEITEAVRRGVAAGNRQLIDAAQRGLVTIPTTSG